MELFTLDSQFRRDVNIDEFSTAIWTERYGKLGDVTVTAKPTDKLVAALSEGTFIKVEESDEVALIDTQSIEDGVLKATGSMITGFLDERIIRGTVSTEREYAINGIPGYVMEQLVAATVITGGGLIEYIPDGAKQVITNLTLDAGTWSGDAVQFSIPYGSLLSALQQIADTYSLGFKMYLASVTSSSYSLKFKVYAGRDLTSEQTTYPVVKFSPAMDTLTDLKKLRAIAGYKTAAYVYGENGAGPGIAYVNDDNTVTNFDRRVIMLDASDVTLEAAGGDSGVLQNMLNQKAKDALANNNYTKVVDGEVVPQSEFKYGTHYTLGDVIELDSGDGLISKARITEYIRAADEAGDRAYPTVTVIE